MCKVLSPRQRGVLGGSVCRWLGGMTDEVVGQVLEEAVPGARVVIVDCPSQQYLPALLRSAGLQRPGAEDDTGRESSSTAGLECIVHLAPPEASALGSICGTPSSCLPCLPACTHACMPACQPARLAPSGQSICSASERRTRLHALLHALTNQGAAGAGAAGVHAVGCQFWRSGAAHHGPRRAVLRRRPALLRGDAGSSAHLPPEESFVRCCMEPDMMHVSLECLPPVLWGHQLCYVDESATSS